MPVGKIKSRRLAPPRGLAPRALAPWAVTFAIAAGACAGRSTSGDAGGAGGAGGGAYAASVSASAPPPPSGLIGQLEAPPLEPGAPPGALLPSPVGGSWLHCYDHFRPEAGAPRDVTRLTMLCGHVNGMRAIGPAEEGEIAEGGEARSYPLALRGGECVRLFAVADAPVDEISLALAGPTGVLAVSTPGARWAVTLADRPLCVAAEGEYTMQVRARKGSGHYAAQAWRLP